MSPIPFFDKLDPKAVSAAQALWDAIDIPGYNALMAYSAFVSNVVDAGLEAPPRAVVRRWAAGVEAGLIDRPVTGENKLRVKKTMETPPTPEALKPSSETAHATIEAAAVTTPEKARKVGTLKLRRELSGDEVAALQTIKETLTTEILKESPPCKVFSAPSDEVRGITLNDSLPAIGKAPERDEVADPAVNEAPIEQKLVALDSPPSLTEEDLEEAIEADNHLHETASDPVQDAVDIIVKHYEALEFAKARSAAAKKAAAALREFANRIEVSA